MAAPKIVMWNCGGIRAPTKSTPDKTAFFDKEYPKANFDIAAFVETHHRNEEEIPDLIKEYTITHHLIHTPTPPNCTHAGIIVLIRKGYDITQKETIIPGRLINIHLTHSTTKLEYNLSIFYGTTEQNATAEETTNIYNQFSTIHNSDENNYIIGDFNFVENDVDKGNGMRRRDKSITKQWQEFTTNADIVDPYRIQCPRKKIYSFIGPTGRSRIDRIYTSQENAKNITDIKYTTTPFTGAHKIMTCTVQNEQKRGPGYWKMNSSILNDPQYIKEIEETVQNISTLQIQNPIDWWDLFIMTTRSITINYTRKKSQTQNKLKKQVLKELEGLEKTAYVNMTEQQKEYYNYYKDKYRDIQKKEIQGHQIRTRGQPVYETKEPNIEFYAKLEKRSAKNNTITQLQDKKGQIQTDNENLVQIATDYYTKLYKPSPVDEMKQQRLLKNIDLKISTQDKLKLEADITEQELQQAVYQLNDNKSPGINGITAEFYKKFWYLIKDKYIQYINTAKQSSLGEYINTSVTTIIFKHKGEIYILDNYRPISLINVDLKILTRALANRLRPVLPTIIHQSQTAVDKRKIDHTIHLIRDLIDLTDKEDSEAAFIFLDQEKAFDRVNHKFLFKTMEKFGIGQQFINWVKLLYTNATTKININGNLSNNIPLSRGVRQGCPLSSLLYVIVIEVLALQLRKNPDIVGFQVGGEKIISLHYADDAIITIKQNRCFKEVYKELIDYETATGAKINYSKTKGLWVGKWKNRQDTPLNIKWTNKNVRTLGIYFGNENPAKKTFEEILPKITKSMNYWKQFKLCKLAKARVIEIFHASRLWYAAKFYNIPNNIQKQLKEAFFAYINYPRKTITISQQEATKTRTDGGAKLIDIESKAQASKIKWLMELTTAPELQTHVIIITQLLGTQRGGLKGIDLFFITKHYFTTILKVTSDFYKAAIKAITTLQVKKKIINIEDEKVFYNPTFTTAKHEVIRINKISEEMEMYTYGQIKREHEKRQNKIPYQTNIATKYDQIKYINQDNRTENIMRTVSTELDIPLQNVTQKQIYYELILPKYRNHPYETEWVTHFKTPIEWKKVWESVHNPLSTEQTKSTIWEQIHLNYYTTYSYNKWHKKQDQCPLCESLPQNKFHNILTCSTVTQIWHQLEPHLLQIHPSPVTEEEKAFGLVGKTPGVILRNWMTYLLRETILEQESIAYHNKKGKTNENDIKIKYNEKIRTQIWQHYNIAKNLGRIDFIKNNFAVNNHLITWEEEQWQVLTIFKI